MGCPPSCPGSVKNGTLPVQGRLLVLIMGECCLQRSAPARPVSTLQSAVKVGEAPHLPSKRQTLCLTSSLHGLAAAGWNHKERKEVDQALSVHTGLPQRDLRGRELVALVIKAIDCPGTHCACRGQQSGLGWPCFLEEGCPQRFSSPRFN